MSTAGVIAPPPRPDLLTSNSRPGGFFSKSNFLGFINFSNCENSLKLRHQFKASDQFRLEVGLDYNVQKKTARPWTGVKLLVSKRIIVFFFTATDPRPTLSLAHSPAARYHR